MIDCNITENYLKEKNRMTNDCKIDCADCEIYQHKNPLMTCRKFEKLFAQKAIAIVQTWSNEHPIKTYLSDFLEKFPNADLSIDNIPYIVCPRRLHGEKAEYLDCNIGINCIACWNRPLEE